MYAGCIHIKIEVDVILEKVIPALCICILYTVSLSHSADWELNDANPLEGTWKNRQGLTYMFDSGGSMIQIAERDSLREKQTFEYDLVMSGKHKLIRYGSNLADDAASEFLMATDLTDSTATFAHGTAFVRTGSGSGLKGNWQHVDELEIIRWHIDHETVTYRHERLDLESGAYNVVESRTGTYIVGHHMDDSGMLYIDFTDSTNAVVFPLLFHDVMYLFDFSEIRSSFFKISPESDDRHVGEAVK